MADREQDMGHTVRIAIDGTIQDYEAFSSYAKRARNFVEANEPGTQAWECFADESTGRVFFHELYEDEDAFMAHVAHMTDEGLMDEFMDLVAINDVVSLSRVEDDGVKGVLTQFNARSLHGLTGIAR